MDDPWGSPWADEAEIHHDEKKNTRGLDVRPTTPVRASTLALEEKTNSPWGEEDDDGFGDWAALPADDEDATGFDDTSDGWEGDAANGGKLDGTLLSPSELPWNGTHKTTPPGLPSLSPSLMPKSTQLLQQPSPDPWATEFVPNDVPPSKPQSSEENGKGGSGQIDSEELQEDRLHTLSTLDTLGVELSTEDSKNTIRDISSTEDHTASPSPTQIIEVPLHLETPEDIPDVEPVSSRPSSPSEHSRHDENLQDSPRTSIEEDSARPPMPRKVSHKVQELVEHFGGLAEVEFCEPTKSRENSPGPQGLNVSNGVGHLDQDVLADEEECSEGKMDDFGDFEEGNSNAGELNDDSGPAVETPAFNSDLSTGPQESDITRERATSLKESHGPVKFDINASALTTIYPGLDYKPAEERLFIPDRDLDNTLSTTEQRKTWYRVSRYGTKRKHDTGNDDNYVRINWAHSETRKDTLKIVARWMEEDRISGRVVLGGASKGSSVFGWSDSKVPPVPIAHVFAAKKGNRPDLPTPESAPEVPREWPKGLVKTRSRSTSKTLSSPKARRHNSVKSVSLSEDIKPIPEAPVANFGWNAPATPIRDVPKPLSKTPPAESPPTSNPISSSHTTSSPTGGPERIRNGILAARTTPIARPLSIVHTGIPILPSLVTDIKNEDEDDWGEMVSSPAISTTPVVPATNVLPHSSNLGGNLSAGVVPPLTPGFQPQMSPLSQTHSPNSSVDKGIATNAQVSNPKPPTTADEPRSIATSPSKGPSSIPAAKPINPSISKTNSDPWASADFSFFESPAPVAISADTPMENSIPKITPNTTGPKTVSFGAPAPTNTSKTAWKSKDEIEQESIVQSIVKGLPDLSYMLRR